MKYQEEFPHSVTLEDKTMNIDGLIGKSCTLNSDPSRSIHRITGGYLANDFTSLGENNRLKLVLLGPDGKLQALVIGCVTISQEDFSEVDF